MKNQILEGDSWKLTPTLEDESVDCIVTSPPYWGLRDYGVSDQFGLEDHPQKYVDKLVELCELLRPKLKKSGVMFWNIGETYFGNSSYSKEGRQGYEEKTGMMMNASKVTRSAEPDPKLPARLPAREQFKGPKSNWLQPKQMLGLPWRFAIAMQDKGWILRNDIIWYKRNHMPSSVQDRFSNAFEHIFMFVKKPKYGFDLDAVREQHKWADLDRRSLLRRIPKNKGKSTEELYAINGTGYHPDGKNPGDVWDITTKPHAFSHFATFPKELVERMIKAGCPEEGLVLDPFMGSGTVAVVARNLKRTYLGFELNPEYVKIAERRLAGVEDWSLMKDIDTGKQKTLNSSVPFQ